MFDNQLDFRNENSLKESINLLANKIALKGLLEINSNKYRITDFEFYINSHTADIQDPHTYNHDLQRKTAKLYDHKSGLDITFGDGDNAVGVLIRGIAKLETLDINSPSKYFISAYFDGPHKARTEIISNIKFNENNTLEFNDEYTEMDTYLKSHGIEVISTKRVNLTPKATDVKGKYIYEPLRYVVLIPKFFHNEEGKLVSNGNPIKINGIEQIIKNAINENTIDPDLAYFILGYKMK